MLGRFLTSQIGAENVFFIETLLHILVRSHWCYWNYKISQIKFHVKKSVYPENPTIAFNFTLEGWPFEMIL